MEQEIKTITPFVNYNLSSDFVDKVNSEGNGYIKNVFEYISGELLQYWIECPPNKVEIIQEYAFMTFIKNPKFQKHYASSKNYKPIGEKYNAEHGS